MKQNNALKLDLGLLCQVVGRRLGVEVVERDGLTTFATNGKQVLIPRNIAGGEIDADIMRGGIAHEAAGHVQHTDFGALGKFMEEMRRTRPSSAEFAKALQNVIEDARIEQAAIRKFPGCRKILGKMVEALESRGFFSLPQPDNAPGVLVSWLIRKLRQDILKQPISTEAMDAMAEEAFGKDVLANIYRVAEAGARGESTEDVLASARAILTILGDAAEPPQPPQPQEPQDGDGKGDAQQSGGQQGQSGDQGGEGQGEDGSSAGSDAGKEGAGSKPKGKGKGKAKKGDTGDGAGAEGKPGDAGQQGQGGQSGGVDPEKARQQAEAAKKALEGTEGEIGKTDIGDMIGQAMEGMGAGRGRTRSVGRGDRRTKAPYAACDNATALTTRLRARLEEVLQSRVQDEDPDLSEHGRLNPMALTRASLGDRRVFVTEGEEAEGLSTAIYVLVDMSGSMDLKITDGAKNTTVGKTANAVIYAMSSAMSAYETQGVKFAMSAFNGTLYDLKRFNDPWIRAREWVGNYKPTGGTMLTESMRSVLPELMHRPEQRKILYVITDGDVGDDVENRKICASAKKENVEVDVLCIGEQHVSGQHGFRKFQRVATHAPAQLQRAIFDTLQRVV